jgi:pyrimidine operon attenuation protein/uracil phosphoribosyltransferase
MQILDDYQIRQKITRMSYEILENNLDYEEVFLAGINNNGQRLAHLLLKELNSISTQKFILSSIKLNPSAPLEMTIVSSLDIQLYQDKPVVVIDDVANTGRTTFYAFKALMDVVPSKIEVAVLVDRKHKSFPVKVDYVGLTLATTIQEHIKAHLMDDQNLSVELH